MTLFEWNSFPPRLFFDHLPHLCLILHLWSRLPSVWKSSFRVTRNWMAFTIEPTSQSLTQLSGQLLVSLTLVSSGRVRATGSHVRNTRSPGCIRHFATSQLTNSEQSSHATSRTFICTHSIISMWVESL